MSADNWTICPKCNQKQQKEHEKLEDKVRANYGLVPIREWLELKSKLDNPMKPDFTLAEDYSIGIDSSGVFAVDYQAKCTVCGFSFHYEYSEQKS